MKLSLKRVLNEIYPQTGGTSAEIPYKFLMPGLQSVKALGGDVQELIDYLEQEHSVPEYMIAKLVKDPKAMGAVKQVVMNAKAAQKRQDPHKHHIGPNDPKPWLDKARDIGEKAGAYERQRAEGGPFGRDQQDEYQDIVRQAEKLVQDATKVHQSIGRKVTQEYERAKKEASEYRDPPGSDDDDDDEESGDDGKWKSMDEEEKIEKIEFWTKQAIKIARKSSKQSHSDTQIDLRKMIWADMGQLKPPLDVVNDIRNVYRYEQKYPGRVRHIVNPDGTIQHYRM